MHELNTQCIAMCRNETPSASRARMYSWYVLRDRADSDLPNSHSERDTQVGGETGTKLLRRRGHPVGLGILIEISLGIRRH